MGTKWKGIKKVFYCVLFFLGTSLTVWNLPEVIYRAPRVIADRIAGKELEDYQQSGRFRSYISSRLEDFLSIAVSGIPAGNYYGYISDDEYWSYIEQFSEDVPEETIYDSLLLQSGAAATDYGTTESFEFEGEMSEAERRWYLQYGLDPSSSYIWEEWEDWEKELTEEERERVQKRKEGLTRTYLKGIRDDKNLLYSISYDGKLLYSNGDLQVTEGGLKAPEGYNFLLYFDGEKVRITKDGQETDVYGDGYYRDDSAWYVPGYRNFPVSEGMKKAVICMAAAKEPVRYSAGSDRDGGYREQGNDLYWMQYNLISERRNLGRKAWKLCAGLLLLTWFFALFRRKERREAAERLAALQGRIWAEVKLLLAGAAILQELLIIERNTDIYWTLSEYSRVIMDGGLGEAGQYFGWMSSNLLDLSGMFWVILFWTIYLIVNDLRYNKKIWRQSLTARCCRAFSARELKQPLSRRMVHRNAFLFGTAVLLGLLSFGVMVYFMDVLGRRENMNMLPAVLFCFSITAGFLLTAWVVGRKNAETAREVEALARRIAEICSGDYSDRSSGTESGSPADGGRSAAGGHGTAGSRRSVDGGSLDVDGGDGHNPGRSVRGKGLETAMSQLENIRQGMAEAVDEQMKSERMKVELIANVSHDLKTPLTSIISYVQFLKEEEGLPEHVRDYVKILDEKSQRLKNMVQDVFAVSKAASGELPMNMEELDFGKLLRQTLADMDEEIQNSRVSFRMELPEKPVMITADGQRMYRVFQNLFQNALKYSLDGSRVYVSLKAEGGLAVASVKNTSHMELDEEKDFTERFFRGDKSRTDGGSGLGLSIAQSFTEACGGQFELEFNADLFIVKISFACRQEE